MEDDQQFCLRWNNHQSTLISVFDTLLENGTLVDCTLAAEGRFLKAHKVVLSACSPYFATLLSQQYDKHPIFILKDVKYQELKAMMDYMYRGEVNISQDQLAALLKAAESLQIKGLSDNRRGGGGGGNSGSGNSANQAGEDNTQRHVPVAQTTTQQQPPQQQQQPGYTIEQRRPLKHTTNDTEVIDSREGSASPTSKRRKRIRRRSIYENNVVLDNHELSNSSSQSMAHPVTSTPLATATSSQLNSATSGGATTSVAGVSSGASSAAVAAAVTTAVAVGATTSGGSPYVMNVTKKTDTNIIHDTNSEIDNAQDSDRDDDASNTTNTTMSQHHHQQPTHHPQQSQTHIRLKKQEMDLTNSKDKMDPHSELLIEPKSEYDDGNDEPVEDLTLDDEELLEDLDQAGPSHGGEGSSQGYAQWQVERSQDEVYMSSQDGSGQHRDAQVPPVGASEDLGITRIAGLTWAQWNARLAMPIVQKMSEAQRRLMFSPEATVGTTTVTNLLTPSITSQKQQKSSPSIPLLSSLEQQQPPPQQPQEQQQHDQPTKQQQPPQQQQQMLESSQQITQLQQLPTPVLALSSSQIPPSGVLPIQIHSQVTIPPSPVISTFSSPSLSSLNEIIMRTNNYNCGMVGCDGSIPIVSSNTLINSSSGGGGGVGERRDNRKRKRGGNTVRKQKQQQQQQQQQQLQDLATDANINKTDNITNISNNETDISGNNDSCGGIDMENQKNNNSGGLDDSTGGNIDDSDGSSSLNNNNNNNSTMDDKYLSGEVKILTQSNGGENGNHQCNDCGRIYKLKSSLRNHQKWECGKEPQFQCPYCSYKAKQKMHIGRHLERMHREHVHKHDGNGSGGGAGIDSIIEVSTGNNNGRSGGNGLTDGSNSNDCNTIDNPDINRVEIIPLNEDGTAMIM